MNSRHKTKTIPKHGLVVRRLLGVFLQGLRQGVHREALRCGSQLRPHIGTHGLQLGDAVVALGAQRPNITAVLPKLTLPVFPVWLTVHRELRTSARIRAVYDFLADEVGEALQKQPANPTCLKKMEPT